MTKPFLVAILCGLGALAPLDATRSLPMPQNPPGQPVPKEQNASETPARPQEEKRIRWLGEEHGGGRRRWQLENSGGLWSPSYLQALFDIAASQRGIFASKFRLAPSTRRGTSRAALAPGRAPEPTWVNLGPTDGGLDINNIPTTDSGRVSQIVANPKESATTLYVAAAEGGLWKTVDAGRSWCSLTEIDSFPSLATGALALDPSQTPATIYLGLGDIDELAYGGTGRGIVKSEDGGKTWSDPQTLGDSRTVTSILVPPKEFAQESGVVLVGTELGLFRSTDSGKSYSPVELKDLTPGTATVRDLNWTSGSKLILTVGQYYFQEAPPRGGADILFSTDGGKTWNHAAGMTDRSLISRISLAVAPSDRNVVYALASDDSGFFHEIFKSTDGGENWSPTNAAAISYDNPLSKAEKLDSLFGNLSDNPQGTYNQLAIVDPKNPDVAYFGGVSNLVKTVDGGRSYNILSDWQGESGLPYIHSDFHTATFDGNGDLWVGSDGGLARSADGGRTWSTVENRNLTTHLVYSLSSGVSDPQVIAAGFQDNGTRVRESNSSDFPQRLGADGFDVLVHPRNSQTLLGSMYYTQIFKSSNGGEMMSPSSIGIDDSITDAPFFTRLIPSPADSTGNTVYTFTNHRIYKSVDFGDSWDLLGPDQADTIRNFNVAAKNDQIMGLLVQGVGPDRVLLSADGGASWQPAGELPDSQGKLSFISFSPVDPKIVYVASRAPIKEAGHLWISRDGGEHWERIDGGSFPTGAPVNVVIGDTQKADTLYAGTHLGLYRSQDGGKHWDRFGARLPLVSVTDIHISPDASLVRIATYGRGLWELRPGAPPSPLPRCPSAPR